MSSVSVLTSRLIYCNPALVSFDDGLCPKICKSTKLLSPQVALIMVFLMGIKSNLR